MNIARFLPSFGLGSSTPAVDDTLVVLSLRLLPLDDERRKACALPYNRGLADLGTFALDL